jgi:hypothetical protein
MGRSGTAVRLIRLPMTRLELALHVRDVWHATNPKGSRYQPSSKPKQSETPRMPVFMAVESDELPSVRSPTQGCSDVDKEACGANEYSVAESSR